jgi:hypothetical protein
MPCGVPDSGVGSMRVVGCLARAELDCSPQAGGRDKHPSPILHGAGSPAPRSLGLPGPRQGVLPRRVALPLPRGSVPGNPVGRGQSARPRGRRPGSRPDSTSGHSALPVAAPQPGTRSYTRAQPPPAMEGRPGSILPTPEGALRIRSFLFTFFFRGQVPGLRSKQRRVMRRARKEARRTPLPRTRE